MRARSRRTIALAAAVGLVGLVGPPSAGAAVQIGETFVPNALCGPDITYLNGGPGGAYSVPSNGVITSWRFQANANAPAAMRLKVGRNVGGNSFTIIGQSDLESLAANQLNTFSTRVPVLAGDRIGSYFTSSGLPNCSSDDAAYSDHYLAGDQPPGSTATYTFETGYRADLAAILEPDADNDGFGDETQDCAPADANRAEDCDAPNAQITEGPQGQDQEEDRDVRVHRGRRQSRRQLRVQPRRRRVRAMHLSAYRQGQEGQAHVPGPGDRSGGEHRDSGER